MNPNTQSPRNLSRPRYLVAVAAAALVLVAAAVGLFILATTEGDENPGGRPIVQPGASGSFITPSGNISCIISEASGVSCHVFEHEWTIDAPTEPDCEFDWGDNVSLGDDGLTFGCYSDVYWDLDAEVLPYGSGIRVTGFGCQSDRTGVTCFNGVDDGFTISRTALEIHQDNS